MIESFSEIHEKALFDRYFPYIKCPKCKSEDIVIKFDEGYFWVCKCNKCGYKDNK